MEYARFLLDHAYNEPGEIYFAYNPPKHFPLRREKRRGKEGGGKREGNMGEKNDEREAAKEREEATGRDTGVRESSKREVGGGDAERKQKKTTKTQKPEMPKHKKQMKGKHATNNKNMGHHPYTKTHNQAEPTRSGARKRRGGIERRGEGGG